MHHLLFGQPQKLDSNEHIHVERIVSSCRFDSNSRVFENEWTASVGTFPESVWERCSFIMQSCWYYIKYFVVQYSSRLYSRTLSSRGWCYIYPVAWNFLESRHSLLNFSSGDRSENTKRGSQMPSKLSVSKFLLSSRFVAVVLLHNWFWVPAQRQRLLS